MKPNFEAILKDIIAQSLALAEKIVQGYTQQATADTKQFLQDSHDNLAQWTGQVAHGELSAGEFQDLIQGQMDLAKMHGLKEAGLAEARLDEFKQGVEGIITSVVLKAAQGAIL